jgi:hypothetical protein
VAIVPAPPTDRAQPRSSGASDVATFVAIAPAVALVLLGVVLIVAPRLGAAIFGLPVPEGPAMGYVRAIGVRDIAFGLYVLALAWFSGRRAAGILLAITVVIPIGDILVLLALTGLSSPGHLALHAASGVYMSAAAAWLLEIGRRRKGVSI